MTLSAGIRERQIRVRSLTVTVSVVCIREGRGGEGKWKGGRERQLVGNLSFVAWYETLLVSES